MKYSTFFKVGVIYLLAYGSFGLQITEKITFNNATTNGYMNGTAVPMSQQHWFEEAGVVVGITSQAKLSFNLNLEKFKETIERSCECIPDINRRMNKYTSDHHLAMVGMIEDRSRVAGIKTYFI